MIEIITILSLLHPNTLVSQNIFDQNQQLIQNSSTEYILNNEQLNHENSTKLKLGTNNLSIIKDGTLQEQLVIITTQETCEYNKIFISEFNYHKNTIKILLPSNCQEKSQHLSLYIDSEIKVPTTNTNTITINTNLVSTSESIILKYKNKIIDTSCWINSKISKTELQDFQKYKLNQEDCLEALQPESYFQKNQKQESFTEKSITKQTANLESNTQTKTTEQQNTTKKEIQEKKNKSPEQTRTIQAGELSIFAVMADAPEEYLILKNNSTSQINLNNSYVSDKTKTKHVLGDKIIEPMTELKISNLKFQINNSEENIKLYNSSDQEIDSFSIKTSQKNTLTYKNQKQDIQIKASNPHDKIDPAQLNTENNESEDQGQTQESKSTHTQAPPSEQNQSINQIESKETESNPQIGILLTEIFANPKGTDKKNEYIEIYNPGIHTLNLANYSIKINNKKYPLQGSVQAGQYLVIKDINVTNNNCKISILNKESEIDSFSYESAKEDTSWIKLNNQWYQTDTQTPEQNNGILNNYQGSAEVVDSQIKFLSHSLKTSSHNLTDGIYEEISFDYLENNQELELLKIHSYKLKQKDTQSQNNKKQNTITSSMGLLSMASLGILYSLFK